jgi:hypothetical protein
MKIKFYYKENADTVSAIQNRTQCYVFFILWYVIDLQAVARKWIKQNAERNF